MKKANLLLFVMLPFLFSCSKSYYPESLLLKYKLQELRLEEAKIIKKDGEVIDCKLCKSVPAVVYYQTNINGKTKKEEILTKQIKDIVYKNESSNSIGDKMVYFGTNEISKSYDIINYYSWRFWSPFSRESTLKNNCIKNHVENCRANNGDAVIIQPNLYESIVIKFKNNTISEK